MTPQEAEKKRRIRYLEAMRANESHPLHGTSTGYNYGCRCEPCRQASREYRAMLAGKRYPTMQFNFPTYRDLPCEADSASVEAQAQKVVEEALELAEAAHKGEGSERVMEECWDVVQACETLLRAYGSKRRFKSRNGVIDKNRERGYYGPRR